MHAYHQLVSSFVVYSFFLIQCSVIPCPSPCSRLQRSSQSWSVHDAPAAPSVIPEAVKCASLRRFFHLNDMTYPYEEIDNCWRASWSVLTPSALSPQDFLLVYEDSLDAACLALIRDEENSVNVHDSLGQPGHTHIRAFVNRGSTAVAVVFWSLVACHWWPTPRSLIAWRSSDMSDRCSIRLIGIVPLPHFPTAFALRLPLSVPLPPYLVCHKATLLSQNDNFELNRLTASRQAELFPGFHNVRISAILAHFRYEIYVVVPDCWEDMKHNGLLDFFLFSVCLSFPSRLRFFPVRSSSRLAYLNEKVPRLCRNPLVVAAQDIMSYSKTDELHVLSAAQACWHF